MPITFYDVYIGDPEDPNFDPTGGDWNGNAPNEITLLPSLGYQDPFRRVQALCKTHGLPCIQSDWGCLVALASPEKILEILTEWYGDAPIPSDRHNDSGGVIDVRDTISNLAPRNYAIVALES